VLRALVSKEISVANWPPFVFFPVLTVVVGTVTVVPNADGEAISRMVAIFEEKVSSAILTACQDGCSH
jgi:hypothetical protein